MEEAESGNVEHVESPRRAPVPGLAALLAPTSEDWPAFPSLHRATLYDQLRDAMQAAGVSEDDADEGVSAEQTFSFFREYDVAPM